MAGTLCVRLEGLNSGPHTSTASPFAYRAVAPALRGILACIGTVLDTPAAPGLARQAPLSKQKVFLLRVVPLTPGTPLPTVRTAWPRRESKV